MANKNPNLKKESLEKVHNSTTKDLMTSMESEAFTFAKPKTVQSSIFDVDTYIGSTSCQLLVLNGV
jgi:hypothetical protein